MKKLATTRQLIFVLIISLITLKVLFFPSLLVKDIGRDCYIFFFIMLVLDFLILCIFLFLYNKYPNLTFYDIIKKMFGTIIAKIIMVLFSLFFLAKCWAVFQSNFIYLNENLHTTIKWYTFSVPILVVVFYMSTFGINAFLRLIELVFPVIIFGFMLSFFTGIFRADFTNLLPMCENGFFSYVPKISRFAFWFGDYLVFVVFLGNVKRDKKFNLKIITSVGAAIIFITLFFAIIYSVFSYNTICHTNSISDIMQVLPSSSDIGGFDWIIILIWDVSLFVYFTLNVLCSFYCLKVVTPNTNKVFLICALLAIVLACNLLTHFDIIHNVEICKNYVVYFSGVIQYLFPVIFFIFSLFTKSNKNNLLNERTKKQVNVIKLRKNKKANAPILNFSQKYFLFPVKNKVKKTRLKPKKNYLGSCLLNKKFTLEKKEQQC